jgi:hypothetical protein
MKQEEYANLAAKYALFLLRSHRNLDTASAEACNLWALLQEGLGERDDNPQVPLEAIVEYVKKQMI